MRKLRTGSPEPSEEWNWAEIMNHLNCTEMKARQILDDYHNEKKDGYGAVEKHLILDFIETKQREEREREARYKSDLANVEIATTLKIQVETLKEQVKLLREQVDTLNSQLDILEDSSQTSAEESRKARYYAKVSNFIAFVSMTVAVISLIFKVY